MLSDNHNHGGGYESMSKRQEQLTSSSWYVILHFPLFYAVTTELTSLGKNLRYNLFQQQFNIHKSINNGTALIDTIVPNDYEGFSWSLWYPALFISIMLSSILFYFITQYSNPGFVRDFNRLHKINYNFSNVELQSVTIQSNAASHIANNVNGKDTDEQQQLLRSNNINSATNSNHTNDIKRSSLQRDQSTNTDPIPILPPLNEISHTFPTAKRQPPESTYCTFCNLLKPERSKHCFKCGGCVAKFDHHCPFMGNCIAVNNHRWFVTFLFFETVITGWAFTINFECYALDLSGSSWYGHLVAAIILFFMVWVALMLFVFHFWLGISNQTTYQMVLISRAEGHRYTRRNSNNNNNNNNTNTTNHQYTRARNADTDSSDDERNNATVDHTLTNWTYWDGLINNIIMFCKGDTKLIYKVSPQPTSTHNHTNNNNIDDQHDEDESKQSTVHNRTNTIHTTGNNADIDPSCLPPVS